MNTVVDFPLFKSWADQVDPTVTVINLREVLGSNKGRGTGYIM
jgi:hypothetical protein